ncbi:MAG: amidohydrolase family protein [Acidimicrobiia bacterium]|nr:amidohydrolase family protein [Acidimicrobiia bacterium]
MAVTDELTDVRTSVDNTDILAGIKIIDTDTHLSEPYDLWTSRAPAKYRDLVPQVRELAGKPRWVVDQDKVIGKISAASVIAPDGGKQIGTKFFRLTNEEVHAASYETHARLKMMDTLGVHAQIIYPNLAGFGAQNFLKVQDEELRLTCVRIYNDAVAEMQADSGERLFPMALVPWWDVDASVDEVRRCQAMGMRGVVTCANPQDAGLPDLATDHWDPFWQVCLEHEMPVNFHIGSSQSIMDWFGRVPWPSFNGEQKLSVGSANIFLGNAQVIGNLIYGGVAEKYPDLKFVSVESGIGWIPFFLEALDYQLWETAPGERTKLSLTPSEYFRRQFYGCFWFESLAIERLLDVLGVGNVMFETDFPHPTCLYPKSDERVRKSLIGLEPETRKRIVQDNAAELYKIPV